VISILFHVNRSVIIYDNDCALCTGYVLFLLRRDRSDRYSFASLTGTTARNFFSRENIPVEEQEALWLIDETTYYYKSSAILRAIGRIGGIYRFFYLFLLVPPVIRDWVYGVISRRRRRFMGNTCPVIPPEYEGRFID